MSCERVTCIHSQEELEMTETINSVIRRGGFCEGLEDTFKKGETQLCNAYIWMKKVIP